MMTALFVNLAGTVQAKNGPVIDIPGCVIWLDANDTDANGKADSIMDGSELDIWLDKSGNCNHAEQSASKHRPTYLRNGLNEKSVLRFDGNDYLTDVIVKDWSSENWTVFARASLDHDSSNHWRGIIGNRFGPGTASWWTLGTKSNGTSYLEFSPGRGVETSFVPKDFSIKVYSVVKHAANFNLFINGTKTGSFKADVFRPGA